MDTHPIRLRFSFRIALLSLFTLGLASAIRAQDDNKPPKGFTAIFNGKDLTGWIGGNGDVDPRKVAALSAEEKVTRQKKLDEGIREHWQVKDGVLITDGNPHFYLSTPGDHGDFEMWVDWKINKKGDSGIYLRGIPQVQIWDPGNPDVEKLGAPKGSGALWNNKKYEKWPKVPADKPVGEWNRMYVRMIGPYVTVKLNDKLVTDNVILENYFDPASPVPARGPVYLQTHTTQLFFRNVFIRDIPADEANRELAKIKKHEADFKPIFNGKDLTGWKGATDKWHIVDGNLVAKEGQHGNLFTDDTYDNFIVAFEFKLPPGGNNGLALRSPLSDGDIAYLGMESQILDTEAPRYKDIHEYQTSGSLYGMAPARRGYLRPTGEWNFEEVTVNGNQYICELNGFEIVNADIAKVREKPIDGKPHPGAARTEGHFGLLGHTDPVAFRNIRIKRITAN